MGADARLAANAAIVLAGSPMCWVNFKFNGIAVNSIHYILVRVGIDNGVIKCKVDASKIPAGGTAIYNESSKTIFASDPDIQYFDQQSTLVHECTHAALDIQKASTTILIDETCAYLAQAIYMYAAAKTSVFKPGSSAAEAYDIIKGKVVTTGVSNINTPIEVANNEVKALQASIKGNPIYSNWASKSVYSGFTP
jgi:hypothetical protein